MSVAEASQSPQFVASEHEPTRSVGDVVEVICLVVMTLAGLVAWTVGAFSKGYDYDEVLRAHSIWLTAQGLRPYSDFFEVHPPYFVLFSPVMRAISDPVDGIRALRLLTATGNLLFLAGMIVLGRKSLADGTDRRWAWLAVAFVAFNPYILDDLVEFRVDGWGYAAIVWATARLCGGIRAYRRLVEFGAASAIAAAVLAPKTVFVPPLIALFAMAIDFKSWRGFVRSGMAYLAGVGIAVCVFLASLLAHGVALDRTILLLGRYHAVSNAHAGFGFGLLKTILMLRPLFFLSMAAFGAWGFVCVHRRKLTGPFEPAVAAWLLMQAVLVTYPYKQYYASWFLFASAFAPSLGPIFSACLGRARSIVFVAACIVSVAGSAQIARFWATAGTARTENKLIAWMNTISTPDDRVVGSPPYHPIRRLDTFFLSFNTTDPGGFDSERIFGELPALRPFVSADHYRSELDSHPPALIVLKSPFFEVKYPATQKRALDDYVLRRGYRTVRVAGVWFALRPDRFEFAKSHGMLE